jgi:hypothetical protein
MGGKTLTYGLFALAALGACGVGSINQTTSGPPASQPSATSTTGNTTGAVQPGGADPGSATTGVAGTATGTTTEGTTSAGDTAGGTVAGTTTSDQPVGATTAATTAGTVPSTTAGTTTPVIPDPNGTGTPTGDPNSINLFDMSALTHACCYYNSAKSAFSLAMNTDAQYCTHVAAAGRVAAAHEMGITATVVTAGTTTADGNGTAPPKAAGSPVASGAAATLSLYDSACKLTAQAKSTTGTMQLSGADTSGCVGTFSFTMQQTMPTAGATPTVINGSFTASRCVALGTAPPANRCLPANSP